MFFRNADRDTLQGLITTEIYKAITSSTNNKPEDIKVELDAFTSVKEKIKYSNKKSVNFIKKLNNNSDDIERLQAIAFLNANIGIKSELYYHIDKYCNGFTNNLPSAFYNQINEIDVEHLMKLNLNNNHIIDEITKVNKLSLEDNSYIISSIENFKKYMVIAINVLFYKSTVLVLNDIEKGGISAIITKVVPVIKAATKREVPESFTLKDYPKNESKLTGVRSSLLDKKLIDEISLGDFRKIFSGNQIGQKIDWLGDKGQLRYLIIKLHSELKLVEEKKRGYWIIASKCFTYQGVIISSNELKDTHKLISDTVIDTILKGFL